jgi:thiopeptide-type bacteriocin biosynthesis protein
MELPSHFIATDPVLLRITSLSRNSFRAAVEFGRDGIPDNENLVRYIRELAAVPALREAISVSSRDLAAALDRLEALDGMSRKRLVRMAISVTRYALRMTGRPTPFGLHSGVAAITAGEPARVSLSGPEGGTKTVRPDAAWFDQVTRSWLAQPETLRACDVVLNDLCYRRGDRLVLPHVRHRDDHRSFGRITPRASDELTLRMTPVLAWTVEQTDRPVPYTRLVAAAAEQFPHLGKEALDAFLAGLVGNEVLLTPFAAPRIDADHLDTVSALLPPESRATAQLSETRSALASYASTKTGSGGAEWEHLLTVTSGIHDSPSAAPDVSLRADAEVTIPAQVTRELASCASVLWEISPKEGRYEHMRLYRRAFVDRYGQHGAVPLPELINPHTGLGFPATYLHPRVSRNFGRHHKSAADQREAEARAAYLAGLAYRGITRADREVCLTEDDIVALTVRDGTLPPPSVDSCFQLLAADVRDLHSGDYQLLLSPAGGGSAGALAGRFSELTGSTRALKSLTEQEGEAGALVAQVNFRPVLPRALNIMQVPDVTRHSIPVGVFADRDDPHTVDWKQLVVAADGERLRLYWSRTSQEVRPVFPHAMSLGMAAPNLVRFLHDLRFCAETKVWRPWDWAGCGNLPVLPRVRLGRVVLAPLTWQPSGALREAASDRTGWDAALARWRAELAVPDQVNVVHHDRVYEIDLGNAFHREMLRRDLGMSDVVLSERAPLGEHAYGWLDGHCNEITVPLCRIPAMTVEPRPLLDGARVVTRVDHTPGGEWAYLKLHCVPEVHEEIIADRIPELIKDVASDIDNWFFVRYKDPDHQLRLRLHSSRPTVPRSVWARLLGFAGVLRESGLIRGFDVASYEPEMVRYGGPEGTPLAEQLFCIDSQLAAHELKLIGRQTLDIPRNILLTAQYAVTLDALGDWDWRPWVIGNFPTGEVPAAGRRDVELASRLIAPGRSAELLAARLSPGCRALLRGTRGPGTELGRLLLPGLDTSSAYNRCDAAVISLLHMQHNRLVGIDPANEARTLGLLSQVARAHAGRERHEAAHGEGDPRG